MSPGPPQHQENQRKYHVELHDHQQEIQLVEPGLGHPGEALQRRPDGVVVRGRHQEEEVDDRPAPVRHPDRQEPPPVEAGQPALDRTHGVNLVKTAPTLSNHASQAASGL
jgi:hypothetical protein